MDETRIQCNKEPGRRANTDSFMWVLRSGAKEEIEAIPLDHKGKEIPGSKGAEGRESINLLFSVEEKIKDLSFEKKKEKRLEASKPILEAFWSWVEETAALPTTNERLTKALIYASNQWK